jgi:predicted TIM-barrel fold metal-dependent hydrolase
MNASLLKDAPSMAQALPFANRIFVGQIDVGRFLPRRARASFRYAPDDGGNMLVDTHLHIIDQSRISYPWVAGEPKLNRDFSYAEYAHEALRAGISDVLHMEVDAAESDMAAETEFVREVSRQPGNLIRGVIANCRPENTDFPSYLERCIADPFVKGFRRCLHVVPDDRSQSPIFRANIGRLEGTARPFDLVVRPHQIRIAAALVDATPGVQFVLDHCGGADIKAGAEHPWREDIADLARRPNVAAKISGVVAYAESETWNAETLRPWIEHVIGCFGWDRVVWGSDWPVCMLGGGLLHWVAATFALTRGCSLDEREKLFWRNADRIWGLGLVERRNPSPRRAPRRS